MVSHECGTGGRHFRSIHVRHQPQSRFGRSPRYRTEDLSGTVGSPHDVTRSRVGLRDCGTAFQFYTRPQRLFKLDPIRQCGLPNPTESSSLPTKTAAETAEFSLLAGWVDLVLAAPLAFIPGSYHGRGSH